jgi:molecular chaperone DnaJ
VPISITQATLGAEITVSTLDERQIKLKIPAGTQNGKLLRVREEGVPSRGGKKGDLYIKIVVQVPTRLSPRPAASLRRSPSSRGKRAPTPIALADLHE